MTWFACYLAFTLLLAGLAWYPCCCPPGTAYPCANCVADVPDNVVLTITGTADNRCNTCDETINGSHILSGYTPCVWLKNNTPMGCGSPSVISYYNMRAVVTQNSIALSGVTHWLLTIIAVTVEGTTRYQSTAYHYWSSGGSSPIDCIADRTLSRYSPVGGTACDFSSQAVELAPD